MGDRMTDRVSWIGIAAAAAAIGIGWGGCMRLLLSDAPVPAVVTLKPAPVEQTLELRTLVQPEPQQHSNARARRDI